MADAFADAAAEARDESQRRFLGSLHEMKGWSEELLCDVGASSG